MTVFKWPAMTVLTWSVVVLVLGVIVGIARPGRPEDLPYGLDSPVIAMDLATNQQEVQDLVNVDQHLPKRWYLFLGLDVPFLIAYGILFYLLARQMVAARQRLDRAAGMVGI